MQFTNAIVMVTGANRGIGKSLVTELLKENVLKIYATARNPSQLPDFNDARVVPVKLDITDQANVDQVAKLCSDTQILINNAGTLHIFSLLDCTSEMMEPDMRTNYFGTVAMMRAFAPAMIANGGGAMINMLSILSLGSVASVGGLCASKAALFSATQAFRAELASKKILVYSVFPGPVDTDMTRRSDNFKTSPDVVAGNIIIGIRMNLQDIYPDTVSKEIGEAWNIKPKAVENFLATW